MTSALKKTRKHDKSAEIDRVRTSFSAWSDETPLNENEAAIAIGMSRPWMKRARQEGTGPEHMVLAGSVIRYRAGALRQWLNEQGGIAKTKRGGRREAKPNASSAN